MRDTSFLTSRPGVWLSVALIGLVLAGCAQEDETALPLFLDAVGVSVPNPAQPVADDLFGMPASAAEASVRFEGRLVMQGPLFPGQELAFVQSGLDLVPVRRGLVEQPFTAWGTEWTYILEPGHIWRGSGSYALASLPITLVPRRSNCAYNGLLAFTFDGQAVSDVWAQLTSETCLGYPIDVAVRMTASYQPGGIAEVAQVRAAHTEELAQRFPTRPLAQLAVDHPGVDLTAFGRNIRDLSVYGFVVGGVNYVSDCPTRHGHYPYCDAMRLPSFSTAKSAFAGVAFLRLGQKYGPEIAKQLLREQLPELRAATAGQYPGWEAVTIENVLDLASGHYGKEVTYDDPESEHLSDGSSAEAIARSTLALPAQAPPGTRFFYRSMETFLSVRAMQSFLRSREGSHADLFDFVVNEVYRPLHIGPGFWSSMRTPDSERQAYGATGLWWSVDDVAKIASLLQNGGRVAGQQLLNPQMLTDTLFQNPQDRGLEQFDRPLTRYNNGYLGDLWGPGSPRPGFACNFWTSKMGGYGGIEIWLLPNGTVYYYFSDADTWYAEAVVAEADRIVPFCR
jgi:hypothetical protein